MNLTAQQKLIRIREMLDVPGTMVTPDLIGLLSDVHLPPRELMNVSDPETWAPHMAKAVASVSEETALAWLSRAMETAFGAGMREGHQRANLGAAEGRVSLVAAVRLVLDLIDRRQLRPPMVRDATDADNPPLTLREHLVSVLRSAGEDVE